jgi:hypothetical protein
MRNVRGRKKKEHRERRYRSRSSKGRKKNEKNNKFWEELIAYLSSWQIAAGPQLWESCNYTQLTNHPVSCYHVLSAYLIRQRPNR